MLAIAFVALAVLRIAGTWDVFSATYDEPAHLAVGLELLDRGTYTYEAQHPPLARVAAALGPYVAGVRSTGQPDMWSEGRAILHGGNPARTMFLARLGMLPFFLLACLALWHWTRRIAGEQEAAAAVALLSLTPPVLAHASVATTDMALTAAWLATLAAFTSWLDRGGTRAAALLGAALGLAVSSKLSAVPFLGLTLPVVLAVHWWLRRGERGQPAFPPAREAAVAAGVALAVLWAAYGFPLDLDRGLPQPLGLIRDGLVANVGHNAKGHATFLLGRGYADGDWRFFPVALGVKTPLGLLALGLAGALLLGRRAARQRDWRLWVPLIAAAVILAISIPARINIGVRHVLPVMAVLALCGGLALVQLVRSSTGVARAMALLLVAAGFLSTTRVHPDYLAYFNELAGRHPERVLVDSDLDWGQDLQRLSDTLRARNISAVTTAYFGSAEPASYGVPVVTGWRRGETVRGWFAVSETLRQRGTARLVNGQWELHPDALRWLDAHQPVAQIGRSMRLYRLD